MRNWLLGLILILFQACGSPYLERPGIPLIWGIQLHEDGQDPIAQNFDQLDEWQATDLMVDIPLMVDSTTQYLPKVSQQVLGSLQIYHDFCAKKGYRLHLGLSFPAQIDMFPERRVSDPVAWFRSLQAVADTVLHLCQQPAPERLILGEGLSLVESFIPQWTRLLDSLRAKYGTRLSYAASIDRVDRIHFWEKCDEISLSYPPLSEESPKTWCRAYNLLASQVAIASEKPLFIYRSNLIGDDADFLLKNRLRFWEDSVKIEGLVLNSIYAAPSFGDSSSYYGLKSKPEALNFIREYQERP